MAQKVSVKVPLTAQQKEKIRRATGRTISTLKVESTGAAMLKRPFRLSRKLATRQMTKKITARVMAKRALAKTIL